MTTGLSFNPSTGSLCFHVDVQGCDVLAYLSDAAWRAFRGGAEEESLCDGYQHFRPQIDGAVARRFSAGGRQPVVLRVSDLQ